MVSKTSAVRQNWSSFSVGLDSMRMGDSAASHARETLLDTGQRQFKDLHGLFDKDTDTEARGNIPTRTEAGDSVGVTKDTSSDAELQPIEEVDDLHDLAPLPPDGGYGWIIMLSSMVMNVLIDGIGTGFGMLYGEFLNEFNAGKSTTAFVGSLLSGMYLLCGPIAGALLNAYGCRKVAIAGSIIAALSLFASSFSGNIYILILTHGICAGFGLGLMYLPAIVMVGFYFEKRRALATGVAVCGSGIGGFSFSPLIYQLLKYYRWQGVVWILSGLVLNGVVSGCLFRPLEVDRIKLRKLKYKQLNRMKHESNKKKPVVTRSEPTLNLISPPIELIEPPLCYSNFLEVPASHSLLPINQRSRQQSNTGIPMLSEEFTDDYVSIPLPMHYYRPSDYSMADGNYPPSSAGLYSIRELSELELDSNATYIKSCNELSLLYNNSASSAFVAVDPSITMTQHKSDSLGTTNNYWPEFDWHRFRLLSGMGNVASRKSIHLSTDGKSAKTLGNDALKPNHLVNSDKRQSMKLEVDKTAAEEVQRLTARRVAPARNYKRPSESAPVVGISGENKGVCYPGDVGFDSTCSNVMAGPLSRRCTITPARTYNTSRRSSRSPLNSKHHSVSHGAKSQLMRGSTSGASSTKMITANPSKIAPWSYMFGAVSPNRNSSTCTSASDKDETIDQSTPAGSTLPFTPDHQKSLFLNTASSTHTPFIPANSSSRVGSLPHKTGSYIRNSGLKTTASQFSKFDQVPILPSELSTRYASRLTITPSLYTNPSRIEIDHPLGSTSRVTISPSRFTVRSFASSPTDSPIISASQFTNIDGQHSWTERPRKLARPDAGESMNSTSFRSVALRHRRSGHHRLTWDDKLLGIPLQYDAALKAQRYSQHSGNRRGLGGQPLTGTRSYQHNKSKFSITHVKEGNNDAKPGIDNAKKAMIKKKIKDIENPMYRKNIFYGGSVLGFPEYTNYNNVKSIVRSMTSLPGDVEKVQRVPSEEGMPEEFVKKESKGNLHLRAEGFFENFFNHTLKQMMDVTLLTNGPYCLYVISNFFCVLGFYIPSIYMPITSQKSGDSVGQSAALMSIVGASSTVTRILIGWISDQPWSNALHISNFNLFVAGFATLMYPLCNSFAHRAIFSIFFGISTAGFICLRSVIMVRLVGLSKLTNAFGLLCMTQGIAALIGPPVAGSMFEKFKVYDHAFYMAGVTMLFSAVLSLPLSGQLRSARHKGQLARLAEILGTDDLKRPVYLSSLVVNVEAPEVRHSNKNSGSCKPQHPSGKQSKPPAHSSTPKSFHQQVHTCSSAPVCKKTTVAGQQAPRQSSDFNRNQNIADTVETSIGRSKTPKPADVSPSRLSPGVGWRRRKTTKPSESITPLTSRLGLEEPPESISTSVLLSPAVLQHDNPYLSLTDTDTLQTIPINIDSCFRVGQQNANPPTFQPRFVDGILFQDQLKRHSDKRATTPPAKSRQSSLVTLPVITE